MRVIALISLLVGSLAQMLLDGQTFTHAVLGIICGAVAIGAGLASIGKDHVSRLWFGRIIAGLGLVLALFCVLQLPSAYQYQTEFNERARKAREMREAQSMPNTAQGQAASPAISTNK